MLKKKINEKNRNKSLLGNKSKPINHFNKINSQAKVQNLYNSILTTTSSNGGNNQFLIPNTTRGMSDINSTRGTNEKIDFNMTENHIPYNNVGIMKKRPISSINKINSYFLVVENL